MRIAVRPDLSVVQWYLAIVSFIVVREVCIRRAEEQSLKSVFLYS